MDKRNYNENIRLLMSAVEENLGVNPTVTINACDNIEKLGKGSGNDRLVGYARFHRAETYYLMNRMRDFYDEILLAISSLEKAEDWEMLIRANNLLGIMSLNRGNLAVAMDFYSTALSYCKKYRVDNMTWMVQTNIGVIYHNVEMYLQAIEQFLSARDYIKNHPDMPGYYENLTSIYLCLAKSYFHRGDIEKATELVNFLDSQCLPRVDSMVRLIVECFKSGFYHERGQKALRDLSMDFVRENFSSEIPVLDIFDDMYEYLEFLLNAEFFEEFEKLADYIEEMTEKSTMMYLKRKIISLKVRFFRDTGRESERRDAAVEYFELGEKLTNENRLMHINMLEYRNRFQMLANEAAKISKENHELVQKSNTDALTGLANRFGLTSYQEEVLGHAIGGGYPLAIEILDIDYFKQFNDNYGHQQGDMAIKTVSECMNELAEKGGIFCARYGGDEFVIVYEGYSENEVRGLAEELKKKLTDRKVEHKFSLCVPYLTISQGICWGSPIRGSKIWDYLHEADKMLYEVKEKSRNDIKLTVLEG